MTSGIVLSPFAGEYDRPPSDGRAPTTAPDSGSDSSFLVEESLVSPFLAEYQLGERLVTSDPASEAFLEFIHELHDDEFDEALYELVAEASDVAHGFATREVGAERRDSERVERLLREHFAPLEDEIDRFFDGVAREVAGRDVEEMSEREFDDLLEGLVPETSHLSPPFEDFLKKMWKKAKATAKRAYRKVKKKAKAVAKKVGSVGLKFLWPKLKKVAKQLLQRVLKYALNKIPPKYRPLARTLAKRLGLLREVEEEQGGEEDEGFFALQNELDTVLAGLVHHEDEVVQDVVIREFGEPDAHEEAVDLSAARERFVRRLSELEEGEDPTPAVEEYVQAILTAVRLGIRLIGRPKVVNFLARYVAQLVRKFVGPEAAVPLARVLVDSGLRLLKLEVTPEDELESARYALAATVEDTARSLADLPAYVLENEALLEGHVAEAMEGAAAANLPQMLPGRVYKKKPHLRESSRCGGPWVMLPFKGRRRYKKHTPAHGVTLTPHIARHVETFGGRSLEEFLRAEAGVRLSGELEAKAHLYEVLAGSGADDVARGETDVPGLGRGRRTWARLHPLTPVAAGMLFQEPGHGRTVEAKYMADPRQLCAGQRLYFLEIPGAYGVRGAGRVGGDLTVGLDLPRREIRLELHLPEAETEELLGRLRKVRRGRAAAFPIHSILRRKLKAGLGGRGSGRLQVVGRGRLPTWHAGGGLEKLPGAFRNKLVEGLDRWVSVGMASEFEARGEELYAALQDEAEGVTLTATVHGPPRMEQLGAALAGEAVEQHEHWDEEPMPTVSLTIEPGYGGQTG